MTTFAILKTSVDSWLLRDDVAVTNDEFSQIMLLAEAEIATDVRLGLYGRTNVGVVPTVTGLLGIRPAYRSPVRIAYICTVWAVSPAVAKI